MRFGIPRILRKILVVDAPIFALENIHYLPEIIAKSLNDCSILAVEIIYSDIRLFCMIFQILNKKIDLNAEGSKIYPSRAFRLQIFVSFVHNIQKPVWKDLHHVLNFFKQL